MWTLEAESIRETVEQTGHMIDAIERFLEPQNGS